MSDPKYVRLADRLSSGMVVDTRSHFAISGLDVQEFPEDDSPNQQAFVRDALRRGHLESASKAEYDEVRGYNEELANAVFRTEEEEQALVKAGQEAQVIRASNKASRKLAASRSGEGGGAAYEADQKRREALLKVQKGLDDDSVPVEVEGDGGGTTYAMAFGDDNPVNTDLSIEEHNREVAEDDVRQGATLTPAGRGPSPKVKATAGNTKRGKKDESEDE